MNVARHGRHVAVEAAGVLKFMVKYTHYEYEMKDEGGQLWPRRVTRVREDKKQLRMADRHSGARMSTSKGTRLRGAVWARS